jgi:hypothetical protein
MSGQIIRNRSIALAIPLLVWGVGIGAPTAPARADDCLAAPQSAAPNGSHWYYHTDRANQRKCWFLGPPGQAGKLGHTAAKPTSAATAETASADTLTPTSSATTQEPVQEKGATPSTSESPPPPAGASSQTGAQAPGAAPAATSVWPDPTAVGTVQTPNLVPSDARGDSVAPTADARAPDVSEGVAQGDATTSHAPWVAASPAATFVEILIVVALGLIVAGLLYRVVMKISMRRGRRIIIDDSKPDWIDERVRREWRNDRQLHGPVYKGKEFIDDLRPSLVPAAGDYSARRSPRADDKRQNYPRDKDRPAQITDEVGGHENKLAQLIRDLDQILQSGKGA